MGQKLQNFFEIYFKELYFPKIQVTDVVEIIIIAFLVYQLMVWIKHTKAWMLLRGIIVSACLYFTRGYLQDAHNSVDCNEFHQRPGNSSSCRVFSRSCEERWSVSGQKRFFGLQ